MIDRLFRRGQGEFQSLLTDAASGLLNDAARRRLDELAAADPALQAQVGETLALTALLGSQPMAVAPRSFALPQSAAATARRPQPWGWFRPLQAMTATAALVLVALIATDLVIVDPASNTTTGDMAMTTTQAAAAEPETAAAGRATGIESMQADGGLESAAPPPDDSAASSPALAPGGSPGADGALPLPAPEAAKAAPGPIAEVADTTSSPGRSALSWATTIAGLVTAALALAAVAASWRARRST